MGQSPNRRPSPHLRRRKARQLLKRRGEIRHILIPHRGGSFIDLHMVAGQHPHGRVNARLGQIVGDGHACLLFEHIGKMPLADAQMLRDHRDGNVLVGIVRRDVIHRLTHITADLRLFFLLRGQQRAYKERLYSACKEAAIFYNKKLLSAEGKAAQEYLKRRGIGGKMAVRFGLGYAPEGWHNLMDYLEQKGYSRKEMVDAGLAIASKKDGGAYDAYRGRLIYPIISATGRVMAFGARTMKKDDEPKYINTGDTPIYNKRYNLYALNMQRGKRVGELIMVEGYMDVISLFAAGIENAVASLGTAMTQQQARLIKRYADKMYLCYDGDSAGQAATLRGLNILSAEGIDPKVIVIPGNMDPDDYVRKFGKNGFLELRDSALDANTFRLTNLAGKYDLKTPDGREEFAKKACAFVGSLQPVERERHIAFISKRTGLSEAVVKAQCGLFAAGIENMPAKSRNTMGKARKEAEDEWDSAELTILSLMLMDADTATYTAAAMMESGVELQNEAIRSAAEELLIKYAGGENTSTAVMISELEPMQAEAISAAEAQAEKIKGDVRQIADDCVKRMLKAKLSAELEDEFAKASGLEGEERKLSLNRANEIAKKLELLR